MQAISQRRSVFSRLAQLLILLYGLILGVALVSPVLNPKALNLVCTSSGYKFIAQDVGGDNWRGDGGDDASTRTTLPTHLLDCTLCLPSGILLLTYQGIVFRTSHLYVYLLPKISGHDFHSYITSAFYARGPPSFSMNLIG